MYPPQLYPNPRIQSRSAARRAAQDLVTKMTTITTISTKTYNDYSDNNDYNNYNGYRDSDLELDLD